MTPDDVFVGSPPLAFTFGLGGLAIFPLRFGAAATLLENASPPNMVEIIQTYKATISFTAPTAYRAMLQAMDRGADLSSLRIAVSAGETLPAPVFEDWISKTGKPILDGIGATEMLHIFITNRLDDMAPGSTGKPVTGYEARVVDDAMNEVPRGTVGRLAVRGPTGCRYLADPRQRAYVRDGWNLTGDSFMQDAAGSFKFAARSDDMIISSGYNIAGPEVEAALLSCAEVKECAVIGVPDAERGQIVQAHVVLADGVAPDDATRLRLQNHVKATIAPYKYPRSVQFTDALPKTQTGKIQTLPVEKRGLGGGRNQPSTKPEHVHSDRKRRHHVSLRGAKRRSNLLPNEPRNARQDAGLLRRSAPRNDSGFDDSAHGGNALTSPPHQRPRRTP